MPLPTNSDPLLKQCLLEYYTEHGSHIDLVEPFTVSTPTVVLFNIVTYVYALMQALQVCMQGVLESLVLLDRLVCMQEWGVRAELLPLFDEVLSPRNMALVGYK